VNGLAAVTCFPLPVAERLVAASLFFFLRPTRPAILRRDPDMTRCALRDRHPGIVFNAPREAGFSGIRVIGWPGLSVVWFSSISSCVFVWLILVQPPPVCSARKAAVAGPSNAGDPDKPATAADSIRRRALGRPTAE
jgi:hypothetical protein